MRRPLLATLIPLGIASVGLVADSHPAMAKRMMREDFGPPAFQLEGRPIGGAKPAAATAAYLTSSRIAATADGALVIDSDSGALIRTDKDGKNIAQVAIGSNAGLLAYDPTAGIAYVADRVSNRIAVVSIGAKLEIKRSITTPVEPYGVALSPDRKTVMVTTIADRALVAYDAATGAEKWRAGLGREPRGLAISPDGTRALVAYLTTGTVDQIDLLESHAADHVAIALPGLRNRGTKTGESFARASFAVTFMGEHEAVIPFQRETPVQAMAGSERVGSYGGGFDPPITQELAFVGFDGERSSQATAQISQHQPRALAWDSAHDALYVAGLGTDSILQIRNASQASVQPGLVSTVTSGPNKCGPDGLAVTADGAVLVWCSFTRNVERVDMIDAKGQLAAGPKLSPGPTVIASALTSEQHDGLVLFHESDNMISQAGGLACASCHPDARADGLSWRIDKRELQTPLLAGRTAGKHPFKWDGTDKDLAASLTSTMKRLGGTGLDKKQTDALSAYLQQLPAPRAPSRAADQVARGKELFDAAGCRGCHDGSDYSDQDHHKFTGSTLPEAKTPSLVGLASSAPYYHDGSAATLEALLHDRGAVHGMVETSKLDDKQVADLAAFLETL